MILALERVLAISSLQRPEDPDVKGGNSSLNRDMSNRGNDQKILSIKLAAFWQPFGSQIIGRSAFT